MKWNPCDIFSIWRTSFWLVTQTYRHICTHTGSMLELKIKYNRNSIESFEMLMFYFEVCRRCPSPNSMYSIVLSICLVSERVCVCMFGPVSKTSIHRIRKQTEWFEHNSSPQKTHSHSDGSTHVKTQLNIQFKRKWQTFSLTTSATELFKIICALSNAKAPFFFSLLGLSPACFRFILAFAHVSCSLLHDVTFLCSAHPQCIVCRRAKFWGYCNRCEGKEGGTNSVIFLFDMPIDRMMCLFRTMRNENEREKRSSSKKALWIMLLSGWTVDGLSVCR